ncbi:MAG: hypothetical protein J7556_15060 [Acidovorax sp.]|nr:hypothetical protein [Acidovorax sp.]
MTLKELIALYRADAFDGQEQMFCSDELLAIYANDGQDEACRRALLLRDSASPMCTISFQAGDESVGVDRRVIGIQRAFVDGHAVDVVAVERMDCSHPGWQFETRRDRPVRLVTGMTTGKLHLWPVPDAPGKIRLTVHRLPMRPMSGCDSTPEIRQELHRALVDWMLYRAYSREDTDLHNDAKAAVALAKFEAEFGRKASGRNEEWVRAGGGALPGPIC